MPSVISLPLCSFNKYACGKHAAFLALGLFTATSISVHALPNVSHLKLIRDEHVRLRFLPLLLSLPNYETKIKLPTLLQYEWCEFIHRASVIVRLI